MTADNRMRILCVVGSVGAIGGIVRIGVRVCVSDSVVGGINESVGCVFAESVGGLDGADVSASTDAHPF